MSNKKISLVIVLIGMLGCHEKKKDVVHHTQLTTESVKLQGCDSVYTLAEPVLRYEGGLTALYEYISKEIYPILHNCNKRDKIISKVFIEFTIDSKGKVVNVEFSHHVLAKPCINDLQVKLLQMKGWKPAGVKKSNACYKIVIPISCLKWEE